MDKTTEYTWVAEANGNHVELFGVKRVNAEIFSRQIIYRIPARSKADIEKAVEHANQWVEGAYEAEKVAKELNDG